MDSLTQATLGAAVGHLVAGKRIGTKAAVLGALIATIPDLDVVFLPFFDPLQDISVHRSVSHSFLFCVLASLLFAWILTRLKWTRELKFGQLLLFTFLVLVTHPLLDAMTTYGTLLFFPFSDLRVSFDSINIVDPVYTLPLLFGLMWTIIASHRSKSAKGKANLLGMMISTFYLVFTLFNSGRVEKVFEHAFEENSIHTSRITTVPVKVGNVHWYGVGRTADTLFLGQYSPFMEHDIELEGFAINEHLLDDLDPVLVDRMKWFAQDHFVVAEKDGKYRVYNLQCDMQGVRQFGDYLAPTAFYYEITPHPDGTYDLEVGMHPAD